MTESRVAPGKTYVPYDLRERTFLYAVRIFTGIRTLPGDMGTPIATKQRVKSGASVGANVE